MYVCEDCKIIFEEPKEYEEDCTPYEGNEGGSFIKRYTGCPICSGGYEEYEFYQE